MHKIAVIPGDGVGSEVIPEGIKDWLKSLTLASGCLIHGR